MSGSLKYKVFSKASLFGRARRQSCASISTAIISQSGAAMAASLSAVASSDGAGNIKSPSLYSYDGATSSHGNGAVISQVAAPSSGGAGAVTCHLPSHSHSAAAEIERSIAPEWATEGATWGKWSKAGGGIYS